MLKWLWTMGYHPLRISSVKAEILSRCKTDIRLTISSNEYEAPRIENIQVKLVTGKSGFNQVDKRWVDSYRERWQLPHELSEVLKYYTGEKKPYIDDSRDKRKMNLTELSQEHRELVVSWFENNRNMVFMDIFKGRGEESVNWFIIAHKWDKEKEPALLHISEVLRKLDGPVEVTPQGILHIGSNLTMQRKGGDGGRKTANMLQFKCNPIYFL